MLQTLEMIGNKKRKLVLEEKKTVATSPGRKFALIYAPQPVCSGNIHFLILFSDNNILSAEEGWWAKFTSSLRTNETVAQLCDEISSMEELSRQVC